MKFRYFLSSCCFLILLFGDSLQQNEEMESPAKEAVIQQPVTVKVQRPQAPSTPPPSSPLKTRVVVVHNNMVPVPIECFQPADSGTCSKDLARVYYDHETRTCKPFSYTGCGGNANRFQSIKNCYRICHPYRYKIRPKVVNRNKKSKAMKVRVLPPKQPPFQGMDYSGGDEGQNPFYGRPGVRSMSMMRPMQPQRPGAPMAPMAPQNYGQMAPQQRQQRQQRSGQQIQNPLIHRKMVRTEDGPDLRDQEIGSGSGLNGNSGQIAGYGK